MGRQIRPVSAFSLRSLLAAGGFLLAVTAAAVVGAVAAADAGERYAQLDLPAWAPPSWLFSPAWTILYLLIATAAWLVWRVAGLREARVFFVVFALQLVLNAAWSPLFFGLGWYGTAFVEICVLLAAIVALIAAAARHHGGAAVLLVPYLAWVGYAAALNLAIWVGN